MSKIAEPSLDPDAVVAGVFSVGARYARTDGRWIEIRLVGAPYDPADTMRTKFREAIPADQLSFSGFEGRWFSTAGAAASQSLVVLLHPVGGGPRVEARSSAGVTREALLECVTLESLERMMVKATIRGDLMVKLTNNARGVEARMAELDGWYLGGSKSLFSFPLGRARAMVAGFAALRGERLTSQFGGIPAGWVPDADPIFGVSPTQPVSAYSRWYRRDGDSFLVSVILGGSDGGDAHALASAGIHWEEWARFPGTLGRRRVSADRSKMEIDVAFPMLSSRFVVFGDGRSAVLAAEQLVSNTDISRFWAWIRKH